MPPEIKIPNNSEIDKALKEFEAKSEAEQIEQVPEVSPASGIPGMVRLVMKLSGGAIKEQKQAEYILLVFAIIIFVVSIYFWFN